MRVSTHFFVFFAAFRDPLLYLSGTIELPLVNPSWAFTLIWKLLVVNISARQQTSWGLATNLFRLRAFSRCAATPVGSS